MENKKVKLFQIRWGERLGRPECPYLRRWVLVFFGYSIRLHHWMKSDDQRHMHDHSWSFITIVLKGLYVDYSAPNEEHKAFMAKLYGKNSEYINKPVRETLIRGDIKLRKAEHKHYVFVPKGQTAWTLLLCGRPKRKWGFWIKSNQFFRPLRYFSKYGHPPCE